MAFRKDTFTKLVGFSPKEWEIVCKKAEKSGMRTGTYIRRIAVQGELKIFDMREIMHLTQSFNKIGRNINQIAAVANSTGSIYKKDIEDMQKEFAYFEKVMTKHLGKLKPKEIL